MRPRMTNPMMQSVAAVARRRANSGPPPAPYSADLQYLFRADEGAFSNFAGTTPAGADDYVKRWDDTTSQFSLGLDSTDAPILKTAQVGAFPAIRFNGTANYLSFLNPAILVKSTTYALLKRDGAATLTILGGQVQCLQFRLDAGTPRLVDTGTLDIGLASAAVSDLTWTQVNNIFDNAAGDGGFRIAGAAAGTVNVAGPLAWRENQFVGKIATGEYFDGDILLLMQYQGLHDTTKRQAVEAWITSTFGV